jgi:hypothetical protein
VYIHKEHISKSELVEETKDRGKEGKQTNNSEKTQGNILKTVNTGWGKE